MTDDFGRANSDSCTYTWCFTKDITAPLAPTALVAQPGHNKIQLTWTNSSSADVVGVKIQRVPWTTYPDYGSVPTLTPAPAYPANQGVGTTVHTAAATPSSAASHLDVMGLSNATRDIYYFGAFAYDAAGNYSVAAAPAQARATSYWLGDIANEAVILGNFDGQIYFGDLVHFASSYGLNQGDSAISIMLTSHRPITTIRRAFRFRTTRLNLKTWRSLPSISTMCFRWRRRTLRH